jgi:hypothetical protein
VEAVGALPVAGDAVVGELELAGVAAFFPFALLSLACGPALSAPRARAGVLDGPCAGWVALASRAGLATVAS